VPLPVFGGVEINLIDAGERRREPTKMPPRRVLPLEKAGVAMRQMQRGLEFGREY